MGADPRAQSRSVLARVGRVVGLMLLLAAAIEVGTRLAWCAVVEHRLSLSPRDPTSLLVRDPDLLYRGRVGPREPEAAHEAARRLRILCLGDWRTWGVGVREEDAYPHAMERVLNSRGAGQPVDAINAATPGYTSYQGLVWLTKNIARYRPDVVTVCFGFNDRLLAGEKTGDLSPVRQTPESFHRE